MEIYRIYKKDGSCIDHVDPYAFRSEKRPGTASVLYDLHYSFSDDSWMKSRHDHKKTALNIYEVHAGSWVRKAEWSEKTDPADGWVTTPFSGTTKAVSQNGLGFDYKWDLGWMNDTLKYMGENPADRAGNHRKAAVFNGILL